MSSQIVSSHIMWSPTLLHVPREGCRCGPGYVLVVAGTVIRNWRYWYWSYHCHCCCPCGQCWQGVVDWGDCWNLRIVVILMSTLLLLGLLLMTTTIGSPYHHPCFSRGTAIRRDVVPSAHRGGSIDVGWSDGRESHRARVLMVRRVMKMMMVFSRLLVRKHRYRRLHHHHDHHDHHLYPSISPPLHLSIPIPPSTIR